MRRLTKNELRCFCSRAPLLAMYGLNEQGRTYVHIKVYKQRRIYGESIHYGGEVRIKCRECLRWNVILFVSPDKDQAVLRESATPPEVDGHGTVNPTPTKVAT